jgi:hypothetical protein
VGPPSAHSTTVTVGANGSRGGLAKRNGQVQHSDVGDIVFEPKWWRAVKAGLGECPYHGVSPEHLREG